MHTEDIDKEKQEIRLLDGRRQQYIANLRKRTALVDALVKGGRQFLDENPPSRALDGDLINVCLAQLPSETRVGIMAELAHVRAPTQSVPSGSARSANSGILIRKGKQRDFI